MHLHGFYFRVDAFDGPQALPPSKTTGSRMAVTEHMLPFTTMTMTWVPERAGNWLFHCHYQPHAGPHRPLGPTARARTRAGAGHENHALREMGGLVMGVHVRPRGGESAASTGRWRGGGCGSSRSATPGSRTRCRRCGSCSRSAAGAPRRARASARPSTSRAASRWRSRWSTDSASRSPCIGMGSSSRATSMAWRGSPAPPHAWRR